MNSLFKTQVVRNLNYWAAQVRHYGNCDEEFVLKAVDFGMMFQEFQEHAILATLHFLDSRETLLYPEDWQTLFLPASQAIEFHKAVADAWRKIVIARIFSLMGQTKDALDHLCDAECSIYDRGLDHQIEPALWARLAQASLYAGEINFAERFALRVLEIGAAPCDIALAYLVLGEICLMQRDYLEGRKFLEWGLSSRISQDERFLAIEITYSLSRTYLLLGNSRKALVFAGRAATLAKQNRWRAQQAKAEGLRLLARGLGLYMSFVFFPTVFGRIFS